MRIVPLLSNEIRNGGRNPSQSPRTQHCGHRGRHTLDPIVGESRRGAERLSRSRLTNRMRMSQVSTTQGNSDRRSLTTDARHLCIHRHAETDARAANIRSLCERGLFSQLAKAQALLAEWRWMDSPKNTFTKEEQTNHVLRARKSAKPASVGRHTNAETRSTMLCGTPLSVS